MFIFMSRIWDRNLSGKDKVVGAVGGMILQYWKFLKQAYILWHTS